MVMTNTGDWLEEEQYAASVHDVLIRSPKAQTHSLTLRLTV